MSYEKNRLIFQAVQIKRFDIEPQNETAVRITAYRELPTAISLAQYLLGISSKSSDSYWKRSEMSNLSRHGCCYPGDSDRLPPLEKPSSSRYFDALPRYRDPRPRKEEIFMRVILHNYEDKQFGVEVPADGLTNCYRPPVAELKATDCLGSVKITNGSDARNPAPSNPKPDNREPGNPGNRADDLLDDMSTEDLKRLLKGILDRL